MVNYEVMFIVDSLLEEDKKNAAVEKVKDIITAEGGEIGDVNVWGMRRLAYPIQKKNEGFYTVIEFKAEPTVPAELDRRLKISDDFIRHIIVNKDDE